MHDFKYVRSPKTHDVIDITYIQLTIISDEHPAVAPSFVKVREQACNEVNRANTFTSILHIMVIRLFIMFFRVHVGCFAKKKTLIDEYSCIYFSFL